MTDSSPTLFPPPTIECRSEPKRYFFDVSVLKLVVMSTVTLTFYQIFWFYRNWKLAKERGDDVIPILRAIFGVLFAYALFKEVRDTGRERACYLPRVPAASRGCTFCCRSHGGYRERYGSWAI